MGGIAAHEFPVHLVEVVGLEHNGRDDAGAIGGLHDHRDDAEEDVEGRLDCGRITRLMNGELGAPAVVGHGPGGSVPYDGIGVLNGEVEGSICSESRIIRTVGCVEWIARRPRLSEGGAEEGEDGK